MTEPRQAWRMVLAHLAQSIKVTKTEPLEEGGIIALVGPAGAGKTTAMQTLAAAWTAATRAPTPCCPATSRWRSDRGIWEAN